MESQLQSSMDKTHMVLGPRTLELLAVDSPTQITPLHEWHRGGAETYVTDFVVHHDDKRQSHLIAKACIKLRPLDVVAEWTERRRLLQENGVMFPEVVLIDGPVVVEEYIPFTFKDAYSQSTNTGRSTLREKYINTFKRICGAGFNPTSLHDARSRGDDVVIIDVGEDLGAAAPISVCALSVGIRAEKSFRQLVQESSQRSR